MSLIKQAMQKPILGGLPHLVSSEARTPKTKPERMSNLVGVNNCVTDFNSFHLHKISAKEPRSLSWIDSCAALHRSHPLSAKNKS